MALTRAKEWRASRAAAAAEVFYPASDDRGHKSATGGRPSQILQSLAFPHDSQAPELQVDRAQREDGERLDDIVGDGRRRERANRTGAYAMPPTGP